MFIVIVGIKSEQNGRTHEKQKNAQREYAANVYQCIRKLLPEGRENLTKLCIEEITNQVLTQNRVHKNMSAAYPKFNSRVFFSTQSKFTADTYESTHLTFDYFHFIQRCVERKKLRNIDTGPSVKLYIYLMCNGHWPITLHSQ